jgi:hypothetical protein
MAACSCDVFVQPEIVFNPPGRSAIAYRVGDFITFRHGLLLPLPGEVELVNWRPTAQGDLALQMMEWWAYLADILTFYNERIANQDYLRTADLPESVQRLIQVLGYRPRPAIGTTGTLAALMSGLKPITLPRGFQIQSKAGPGKQPQIFELNADTLIQPASSVSADPALPSVPSLLGADGASVLLQGSAGGIKAGDELLLIEDKWAGTDLNYSLVVVKSTNPEKDPRGKTNTRVAFTAPPKLPSNATPAGYHLLKSTQSAHLWSFPATIVIAASVADLESVTRLIRVGDPVLFTGPGPLGEQLVSVLQYSEIVWYANAPDPNNPQIPPDPSKDAPIPIPHSEIVFRPPLTGNWNGSKSSVLVRFAWQDVGTLIATPAAAFSGSSFAGAATSVIVAPPALFPAGTGVPVLIEDAKLDGEPAFGTTSADGTSLQLSFPSPPATLAPPLNVLFNLLPVSRGKTVPVEVLGSGDATVAGQEFVLKNSPLTYLLNANSTSGPDYKSTLIVRVNGVQWKEVPSFFGQPPSANIFVTREDEQNKTHVQFGDGVNGARLPSGVNNVVATYRYGGGKDAPAAGSLTVILQQQPGLKEIRNPVPVGGGADADPPDQIRKYAPQSVLTFGRAVSGDDYETIAAQAPGVARAKAYWAFDPIQQRTLVTVYVGDDASAVASARTAVAGSSDPNRPVVVYQAAVVTVFLTLTLVINPDFVASDVVNAATGALIDPDRGLFGVNVVGIGQPIFESQIYKACLDVPGAVAVHSLLFSTCAGPIPLSFRFDSGDAGFFQLAAANLTIHQEVAADAG